MKIKVEINISDDNLIFLETMFGAPVIDWEIASKSKFAIKPNLETSPNDIASHINDLVDLGIKKLKEIYPI